MTRYSIGYFKSIVRYSLSDKEAFNYEGISLIPDLPIFIGQKQTIIMEPLLLLLFHLNFVKLFQQILKNCLTLPSKNNT